MKKYLIMAATLIVSIIAVNGQSYSEKTITGTSKVTKQQTPQAVIDALNTKFPDAKSVQYYKIPKDAAKKGWEITEQDNLTGDEVDFYTISFKRDDLKYFGLYKKNGELVQSRVEEKVGTLPEPIVNSLKSIGSHHPGYKVTSKTFYKNQNYSKSKEYYEVIAEKGSSKKRLFYDADGTLIKIKG
jgi:hypothetical protein